MKKNEILPNEPIWILAQTFNYEQLTKQINGQSHECGKGQSMLLQFFRQEAPLAPVTFT
jgi:hypothetical protein